MKVPFVFGPDDLRMCDLDAPRAGPGDVVLRVATVGICGSDLAYVAAGGVAGPAAAPFPLGHELSATVVEAGSDVTSVAIGDRVVLNPLHRMIGNGAAEGGFGERLLVRDVATQPDSLLHLPDELSFETGALVEPMAVATHAANRLGAVGGSKVAVYGAGPIGLLSVVVLRARGIDDIVVFELSAFRRARALQLGARAAIDPLTTSPREALLSLHGSVRVFRSDAPQTTHFLEASGAPVLPEIVALARAGATICVASSQKKIVPIDFQTVMTRELTINGALGYPSEFQQVLAMLKASPIDLRPVISHRFDSDEFMAAFDVARQPGLAAKVLINYAS